MQTSSAWLALFFDSIAGDNDAHDNHQQVPQHSRAHRKRRRRSQRREHRGEAELRIARDLREGMRGQDAGKVLEFVARPSTASESAARATAAIANVTARAPAPRSRAQCRPAVRGAARSSFPRRRARQPPARLPGEVRGAADARQRKRHDLAERQRYRAERERERGKRDLPTGSRKAS